MVISYNFEELTDRYYEKVGKKQIYPKITKSVNGIFCFDTKIVLFEKVSRYMWKSR